MFFFLMIRRPPRSTRVRSSAASDVYKRQGAQPPTGRQQRRRRHIQVRDLSLIHISEPTRLLSISYAVFCLKKKKNLIIQLNKQNAKKAANDPVNKLRAQ